MKHSSKLRSLLLILAITLCMPLFAQDNKQKEPFDWNPVMDAIIQIESRGIETARNGQYVGVLQIAPVLVRECNDILKSRGDSRRFTLNDRLSREKSKEMFVTVMSKYNPENNIDKACRIWKMGIGYTIKGSQKFVNRVRSVMKQQAQQKAKSKE